MHGFDLRTAVLSEPEVKELLRKLPPVPPGSAGSRKLHELSWLKEFATSGVPAALAKEVLGDEAKVVRILYFDKQPGSNWKLPYHQDLTIAVGSKHDVPGYGPWSVKDGIPHVQPPVGVLEHMIAVRLHLDRCHASNGALRVIPGSHAHGKLTLAEVDECVVREREVTAEAEAGDAILMRPLLLHASSPSSSPSHRRVLHIEYAAADLCPPLQWYLGWPCALSAAKPCQPEIRLAPRRWP